jgi:hypothetical protein
MYSPSRSATNAYVAPRYVNAYETVSPVHTYGRVQAVAPVNVVERQVASKNSATKSRASRQVEEEYVVSSPSKTFGKRREILDARKTKTTPQKQ